MNPIWMADATELHQFPALSGAVKADVVVVGGGITGLLVALRLSRSGKQVVLLEEAELGRGKVIGIPREYRMDGMPEEIEALWAKGREMLRDAGAEIRDISLPHTKYALPAYYIVAPAEASSNLARYDGVRYGLRVDGKDIMVEPSEQRDFEAALAAFRKGDFSARLPNDWTGMEGKVARDSKAVIVAEGDGGEGNRVHGVVLSVRGADGGEHGAARHLVVAGVHGGEVPGLQIVVPAANAAMAGYAAAITPPELQGRFPIRVELAALTRDDFAKILREPKNALLKQYSALLAPEGVTLSFTDDAIDAIADIAAEAHVEAMKAVRPGMKEYEVEALIEQIFRRHGAAGHDENRQQGNRSNDIPPAVLHGRGRDHGSDPRSKRGPEPCCPRAGRPRRAAPSYMAAGGPGKGSRAARAPSPCRGT